jgi:hypothetical protein
MEPEVDHELEHEPQNSWTACISPEERTTEAKNLGNLNVGMCGIDVDVPN